MRENFDFFFQKALDHEGRVYEDIPGDRGGPTKCGVTLGRWCDVKGVKLPKRGQGKWDQLCADLRDASMDEIEAIYRRDYWDAVGGDDLPGGVDYCIADFGLNSGPSRAVRYLQKAVGMPQTGKVSPGLLEAVAEATVQDLVEDYCDARAAFLQAIVDRDPSQKKFRKGWLARVEDVRKASKKMAGKTVPSIKDYRDPDVVMPKAEPPGIGPKDLAGSRKMTLVQRMQAFWASLGLGGVGLSVADGMGYAKDFSQVFKDNAGLLLILGSVAGIGAGVFLARWMVEDAREGRYSVGRD